MGEGGVLDFASLASARVVDLSLTVSERLPGTWPGHMTYAHHNWNWFAEVEGPTGKTRSAAPYQTNFVVMDEHCGTTSTRRPTSSRPKALGCRWRDRSAPRPGTGYR